MNQNLSPVPTTASSSGPAPRILIVDDDPLLCGLHALLLEQKGYDAVTAGNGEDALTQLASGDFNLVITDGKMPILDGPGLVLALRFAGNQIPVIMISGALAHSPLPPAVAREVCIALVKPAHPKEILAAVATALTTPSPAAEKERSFPSRFKTAAEADAFYMID